MSEADCIFCKIINKEIPADTVYEDDEILAFRDVNPQAPVHVLVIPKKHIPTLGEAEPADAALLGGLLLKVGKLAERLELANGYRLVNNCGEDGLQTVGHLHFHLLGRRRMQWPPG